MTDYAELRAALDEGPTSARLTHPRDDDKWQVNGIFANCCSPETIRALLAERDALSAEVHRLTYGSSPTYGCHCDLEPHMKPDGCVIDEGRPADCVYARTIKDKTQCQYWQPIKVNAALATHQTGEQE